MLSCGCHKGIPRQTEHSTGSAPTLLDLAPSEVFILSKLESAQEGKGFDEVPESILKCFNKWLDDHKCCA
jgi:hypothetical protein